MIHEYALEPEMVAAWCTDHYKCQFFLNKFGLAEGRLLSPYPKRWRRKVYDAFRGGSDMDKARLTELLSRLQDTMIKRKDPVWDENETWVDNAVQEHARYPFRAVLARNNPASRTEILCENDFDTCPGLACPHSLVVNRTAQEMAESVRQMLACCRWVKFIDPHLWPGKKRYRNSLQAFLKILVGSRPVGPPETIEIHTEKHDTEDKIILKHFQDAIPDGLKVALYQWQKQPGGQALHNRYILSDLGGVSFHHGLDTGADGETDDLTRLDLDQYRIRRKEYDTAAPAFAPAAPRLIITGTLGG
jgi:hypothetical protein